MMQRTAAPRSAQPANEIEALIGGDPAGDDQQNAPVLKQIDPSDRVSRYQINMLLPEDKGESYRNHKPPRLVGTRLGVLGFGFRLSQRVPFRVLLRHPPLRSFRPAADADLLRSRRGPL